ncbi:universal stress protein [candidate division KSB1 bacterium]
MIRRILIPLDHSPYSEAAVDYGCFIAKQHKVELTGLAVLDIPGIEKSVGPVPVGGSFYAKKLREDKKKDALDQIEALLANFKEKCQKEGVICRESGKQGSPSDEIFKISMFYDIAIMGLRTHFNFEEEQNGGDSLDKIINHSITPILAVPDHFSDPSKTKNVLIPFNGSLPATRALQRFVQLPEAAMFDVTILVSDENMDVGNYYLDQAEAYLKAYSFKNITKKWTPDNIIDAMEKIYYEQADLVVAGMHSKKGFLDFLIGSLSKFLIRKAEKPVLLGQ